jgi:predicted HTH domain antitoxin
MERQTQTILTYPKGFPQLLKMSDAAFVDEMRFMAAAKLYELGRVSSGQAARLAGLGRVEFLYRLAQIDVPAINLQDEEIEAEIQAARELSA